MTIDLGAPSGAFEWRSIGPHRGGRVVAVAGHPTAPMTFYFGAAAGGVWKTTDGGTYWENISDGFFKTASVGAIAVSESDPNVIYAGMGESCIRGDVSHGDGVYRSTDGGKTWANVGLTDTQHIARIRIHPRDPDVVYVAALGHMSGPNEDRGVFRSRDGGKSWDKVLYRGPEAGAADLSLDVNNPRILYAAIWQTKRVFWELTSGGPESGLFKSNDGGDSWVEITNNPGLPAGMKGRMGVAVSPSKPERVWATIEAADNGGGMYRSDDSGATWQRTSDDANIQLRPWYYEHVFVDPTDADTIYTLNVGAWKSIDGGKTFTAISTPHADNHDLWIDPKNPERMIEGNDGGAVVSFNGGATWSSILNQPTAQFYHVATDNQFPYRLYGTQQDNSAISVPSRSFRGGISIFDCYAVGTSESGHIVVRPDDPNVVFSGAIGSAAGGGGVMLRYDHRTQQQQTVTVWPELYGGWGAKDMKYRFQWTFPILISPHDVDVLYACGNRVFRSRDEGMSWEPISPDLTRNDESKLGPSGGQITHDTSGAEVYCTIFAFAESPLEKGLFWAGSDDGLVHISRDGGSSWEEVTPRGLPEWTQVTMIEASPHNPAVAYLAATRYKTDDDFTPFLFKTSDYGKNWEPIATGVGDLTRVIREDPVRPGLLYAGTETGVFMSPDDGASWQSLQLNLPVVPVYDLVIKEDDLIAATHGRAFWILDDLYSLRQACYDLDEARAHVLRPRESTRFRAPGDPATATGGSKRYALAGNLPLTYYDAADPVTGEVKRVFLDSGKNPPAGAVVYYYLPEGQDEEVTLSFLDSSGALLKSYSSRAAANSDLPADQREPLAPSKVGLNRFVWNLRAGDATRLPGDVTTQPSLAGPMVPPGTYEVQLKVGDVTLRQQLTLRKDPRVRGTQEDLDAQFELLIRIRDTLSRANESVNIIRSAQQQVDEWLRRAADQPAGEQTRAVATRLKDRLSAIEDELVQKRARVIQNSTQNLQSKLNLKIATLGQAVSSADARPTQQSYDVLNDLSARLEHQVGLLRQVLSSDLEEFNQQIRGSGLPPVLLKSI